MGAGTGVDASPARRGRGTYKSALESGEDDESSADEDRGTDEEIDRWEQVPQVRAAKENVVSMVALCGGAESTTQADGTRMCLGNAI